MQALRARLQQSETRAVDSAPYLELEERRRRAEEGKREALRELDLAAEEVSRVRAAKAQLEDRLQVSEHSLAQMSGGGATGTTVDGEYEEWSNDSGGGGGSVALIQKQRGVLISLTSKLNEKDAAALHLQDQLGKAEKKIRDLEETLARKTAQLIHLQRVALERGGADAAAATTAAPEAEVEAAAALAAAARREAALAARVEAAEAREAEAAAMVRAVRRDAEAAAAAARAEAARELRASFEAEVEAEVRRRLAARDDDGAMTKEAAVKAMAEATASKLAASKLRERCQTHTKERKALATILDGKVTPLLSHVAELLPSLDPTAAAATAAATASHARAVREVGVLQRLVSASVSALNLPEEPLDGGGDEPKSEERRSRRGLKAIV